MVWYGMCAHFELHTVTQTCFLLVTSIEILNNLKRDRMNIVRQNNCELEMLSNTLKQLKMHYIYKQVCLRQCMHLSGQDFG